MISKLTSVLLLALFEDVSAQQSCRGKIVEKDNVDTNFILPIDK